LTVELSPDEKRAAAAIGSLNGADTWILDIDTGVATRMTSDSTNSPVLGPWSPDSQRLAINDVRGGVRD
jgi:hypothetical protein